MKYIDRAWPPIPKLPDYVSEEIERHMANISFSDKFVHIQTRVEPAWDAGWTGMWRVTIEAEIPKYVNMPEGMLPMEVRVDFSFPMRRDDKW